MRRGICGALLLLSSFAARAGTSELISKNDSKCAFVHYIGPPKSRVIKTNYNFDCFNELGHDYAYVDGLSYSYFYDAKIDRCSGDSNSMCWSFILRYADKIEKDQRERRVEVVTDFHDLFGTPLANSKKSVDLFNGTIERIEGSFNCKSPMIPYCEAHSLSVRINKVGIEVPFGKKQID